jgi:hypothetical protein
MFPKLSEEWVFALRNLVYARDMLLKLPTLSIVVVVIGGEQGPDPRLRLHCCTPCFLEVPTVTARCLHVLRDARDPRSDRWNLLGETE